MDLNPYEPPSALPAEAIPNKAIEPRSLFVFVFVDLWKQFLRSRDAIICDLYLHVDSESGIRLSPTKGTTEARNWWLENQKFGFVPTAPALDRLEDNFVIVTRLFALWMLLWTNLLPVAIAGWWLMSWMNSAVAPGVLFPVRALVCVMPIYFVSLIVSLYLHVVFAYPLRKLVNWLFPTRLFPPKI